jgi:hypothetical protein
VKGCIAKLAEAMVRLALPNQQYLLMCFNFQHTEVFREISVPVRWVGIF